MNGLLISDNIQMFDFRRYYLELTNLKSLKLNKREVPKIVLDDRAIEVLGYFQLPTDEAEVQPEETIVTSTTQEQPETGQVGGAQVFPGPATEATTGQPVVATAVFTRTQSVEEGHAPQSVPSASEPGFTEGPPEALLGDRHPEANEDVTIISLDTNKERLLSDVFDILKAYEGKKNVIVDVSAEDVMGHFFTAAFVDRNVNLSDAIYEFGQDRELGQFYN
ncbi:MAG: hypothetical protein UR81_C0018G0006 [Candidatus Levybacteria bacterium GW2011_GWB1_35_5]|nr:MAG: hypothetical protein UR81_C0018G0006 [Candidatus Levybacteria bacterium GW2011_GWB1_35_5]